MHAFRFRGRPEMVVRRVRKLSLAEIEQKFSVRLEFDPDFIYVRQFQICPIF